MRRLFLILMLLQGVAPAQAARVWSTPAPIADTSAGDPQIVVAGGTQLTTWVDGGALMARYGPGTAVVIAHTTTNFGLVKVAAARSGDGVIAWATGASDGILHTWAVAARPDGTFDAPVDIGTGAVGSVVMNDRGDSSVTTGRYQSGGGSGPPPFEVKNAFRPAGGAFGPSVTVPDDAGYGAALTSKGVALFPGAPANGVDFYARVQDGPISGPQRVALPGAVFQIVTDAAGRALAISPSDGELVTTTFDGATWGPPMEYTLPVLQNHFEAAADAAGDVVIAWRDVYEAGFGATATVRAMAGTIGGGLSAPVVLDNVVGYTGPSVSAAPDGTVVIAYDDLPGQAVRVVRSTNPGTFTVPQVAACGEGGARVAGLDADDDAVLQVGTSEVRDSFSTTPVADQVCRVPETGSTGPRPSYSRNPIVVGQSVGIDDRGIRRVDWDLNGCTFDFGDATEPNFTAMTDHTWTTPGRRSYTVVCNERARVGGAVDVITDTYSVDVFAPAALSGARRAHRAVIVTANAFTGASRVKVTLSVRSGGRVLGTVTRRLGAEPETVRIPLSRPPRGAARVVLRQHHRVRASARLRRKPVR